MEKTRKLILQVGETTHTHVLESDKEFEYETKGEGHVHLVITSDGVLRHEEHGTMVLKPGTYHKFAQVEYDPMMGNIRQVFD